MKVKTTAEHIERKLKFLSGSRDPSEIPRVLLDECPRLSRDVTFPSVGLIPIFRCVGRNFCNSAMMITKKRENRLTFSSDRRGFLVSLLGVHSE